MCIPAIKVKRERGLVVSAFTDSAIHHIHNTQELALFKVLFLFYCISVIEKDRTTLFLCQCSFSVLGSGLNLKTFKEYHFFSIIRLWKKK